MPAKLRMKGNTLHRMMTKAKGERDKMSLWSREGWNGHIASIAGHSVDSSVTVGPCKDIALSSVSHGDLIIFNDFATGQEDSQGKKLQENYETLEGYLEKIRISSDAAIETHSRISLILRTNSFDS